MVLQMQQSILSSRTINDMTMSSIKDFYRGEDVFITGASGFIGKVLVEKILRTCSEVKTVYLLMRAKKGQTPEDRIKVLTDNPYFSKLKTEQPGAIEKLRVIEGDSKELSLGMSDSDFEKVKSCSMIFHLAASVRFDDPLKDAILLNTRGAREVCELAKIMPNLKVLVHVSTAYVQPLNLHVVEELIDVDSDWRDYIKMAENLPVEVLDAMTMKLTNYAPNTYTYTKLLAEHICNDYRDHYNLPIVIYRPSVVAWTDSEPLSGWSESMNGLNAIFAAYCSGISRVLIGGKNKLELIPVDLCVKGMIIASEKHQKCQGRGLAIPVYNASAVHRFTFRELIQHADKFDEYYEKAIGLPSVTCTSSEVWGTFLVVLYQIIPALLIDSILLILKRKPMLMKFQCIYRHTRKSLDHFGFNEFTFENSKFNALGEDLRDDHGNDFYMEPRLEFIQYLMRAHIVSKEVVLNETAECAARAKKRAPYWRALWWAIKALFFFVVYKTIVSVYETVFNCFV